MISYPLPTAGKESRQRNRSSHSSFLPLALKAQGLSSAWQGYSLLPNFKTCMKVLRVLFLAFFFFLGKGCRCHFDEHDFIAIINSHTSERLWLHPWLTSVFQEWLDKEKEYIKYIYIHTYVFQYLKKGDLAIWNNMDESGGHYAKWNKPNRKSIKLYNLTYIWNL